MSSIKTITKDAMSVLKDGIAISLNNINNAFKLENYNNTFKMDGKTSGMVSNKFSRDIMKCSAVYVILQFIDCIIYAFTNTRGTNALHIVLGVMLLLLGIFTIALDIYTKNRYSIRNTRISITYNKARAGVILFLTVLTAMSTMSAMISLLYSINIVKIAQILIRVLETFTIVGILGYSLIVCYKIVEDSSEDNDDTNDVTHPEFDYIEETINKGIKDLNIQTVTQEEHDKMHKGQ